MPVCYCTVQAPSGAKAVAPLAESIASPYRFLAPPNDALNVTGIVTVKSEPDPLAVTPCGFTEHWLFARTPVLPIGALLQLSVSS